MKQDKNLIQSFKDVGSDEIPEAGADVAQIIQDVLKEYPNQWFTQRNFTDQLKDVEGIGKSNPYINNVLRNLSKKDKIERKTSGRKVFYRGK